MMTNEERRVARRVYAKQVAHAARTDDPRLEAALADLPRERFLPPGPWHLAQGPGGYRPTPDADPIHLYQDCPVALKPERRLNTGQPSFLVSLIARAEVAEGGSIVHVGCGTGYYTAILSRLAGAAGRVLAIEHDADLAAHAAAALSGMGNVRVAACDGTAMPLPCADVILVNAGTSRPAEPWLVALKPGGRLILPLTVPRDDGPITDGIILLITRRGERYAARAISGTRIYPCAGARDAASDAALAAAFARGGAERVTTLRRDGDAPEAACWLRGPGWCLTCE